MIVAHGDVLFGDGLGPMGLIRLLRHLNKLVDLLVGGEDLLFDQALDGLVGGLLAVLLRGLLEELEAGGRGEGVRGVGGGGLDGEGDDGAADLDGGGVVEVEVKGVVGQDERAELGQVVFQLELLQLPVVLYHRVAPRHRDVAHSHVRVVASADHELNFCLFRHQQVHHP